MAHSRKHHICTLSWLRQVLHFMSVTIYSLTLFDKATLFVVGSEKKLLKTCHKLNTVNDQQKQSNWIKNLRLQFGQNFKHVEYRDPGPD